MGSPPTGPDPSGPDRAEDGAEDTGTRADSGGARSEARGGHPAVQTCERCGHDMYDRHCKVVCPNCGYLRDCSDP